MQQREVPYLSRTSYEFKGGGTSSAPTHSLCYFLKGFARSLPVSVSHREGSPGGGAGKRVGSPGCAACPPRRRARRLVALGSQQESGRWLRRNSTPQLVKDSDLKVSAAGKEHVPTEKLRDAQKEKRKTPRGTSPSSRTCVPVISPPISLPLCYQSSDLLTGA